jgi:hypothetical protein
LLAGGRLFYSASIQMRHDTFLPMTIRLKLLGAVAVSISMAGSDANAGRFLVGGPDGYGHASWNYRSTAPRFSLQQPNLGAAAGGASAGAAVQLLPRTTEALVPPPGTSTSPAIAPPVVTAQGAGSPPGNDVLDDIEGNSRGITRQEVEAALTDWCASHADAPLCVKLRVAPPPPGYGPSYRPAPDPYYRAYREPDGRGYYRPGRFRTWNGCQHGWTVQDGLCKPYRGY